MDRQSTTEKVSFTTTIAAVGQRLDRWLADELPMHSRSAIQRWIKAGAASVNGVVAKAGQVLEANQRIELTIPEPTAPPQLKAEALPLEIIYEDNDLLIINKSAGMVVHPAPGHESGTLVHAILHHCPTLEGVGGERRPGIVHRLDKETSGLLLVAKNDRAHQALQAQFKARTIYKEYLALVDGIIEPAQGRINAPIGRHPIDRKRQAVLPIDPQTGTTRGRAAVTDYYREAIYTKSNSSDNGITRFSYLRVVLHTGRTHQIRVHFAWQKHPVVGDTLYGYRRQRIALDRQFLHAHKLRLQMPGTEEEHEFIAPLPTELADLLTSLSDESDST